MRLRSRTFRRIQKRMHQHKVCSVYFTPTKPDKLPVQTTGPWRSGLKTPNHASSISESPVLVEHDLDLSTVGKTTLRNVTPAKPDKVPVRGRGRPRLKKPKASQVLESPVLVRYDLDLSTASDSTSRNVTPAKPDKRPVRGRGRPRRKKPNGSAYFTPIKPDELSVKKGPGRPRLKKPKKSQVLESPVLVRCDLDLSTVSESSSSGAMNAVDDSLDFGWAVQKLQDLNQGFPPLGRSTPIRSVTPQKKIKEPPSTAAKKWPGTTCTKKDTSPKGDCKKNQQSNCKVINKKKAQNTSSPSSKKCLKKRSFNSNEREDAMPKKRCQAKVSESQNVKDWYVKKQEAMADVIRTWTAKRKDKGPKPWELQTVPSLDLGPQVGSPDVTPRKTLRVLVPRLETQGLLQGSPTPPKKKTRTGSTKEPHSTSSKAKVTKSPKAKNGKGSDDFSWVRCEYCSDLTMKCAKNEHVNKRHRFRCYYCRLFFHSKEERDEHKKKRHYQKPHQEVTCELCEKVYASMTNFQRHLLGREHTKLERIQKEALDYIINKIQTARKDGCIMIGDIEYRPVTMHRLPALPENSDTSSNSDTPSNRTGKDLPPGGDSQGQTEENSKNGSQESMPNETEVCRSQSNEISLDMTGFLESLMDIDLPTSTSTDVWTVPTSPKFRNHEALASEAVNPDNQNGDLFPTTGTSSWAMDYAEEDYGLITTATVTLLDVFPENQLPGNSDCSQVNYTSL